MYDQLQKALCYRFRDPALLRGALTHSSYANENKNLKLECNERLEFLGDSILGFVVADALYRRFPDRPEGEMTRMRADMVCEAALARAANEIGLGQELLLGRGEDQGGGRTRASILADAMESVIEIPDRQLHNADYKTALQELVQRRPGQNLFYRLAGESGPDHDKRFIVEVLLNGEPVGTGEGSSKKRAEQAAAHSAMLALFPNETAR